jgi:hypothetical protein
VNDQLRAVQIQNQKTFSVFASALQSLVDATQTPPTLQADNEGISRCIEDLTAMLKEPEMYATPEHQAEFRSIIRDRVTAKIQELELLARDGKAGKTHIEQQEKSRKEAQDHLETMKAAHEPVQDSEAHVVSEEENVRQQAAFLLQQEVEAAEIRFGFRGEQNRQVEENPQSEDEAEEAELSTAELEQRTAQAAATILSFIWEEERDRQRASESDQSPTAESVISQIIHRGLRFMDIFLARARLRAGIEELQRRQHPLQS